jgi:hypothetical protein
MWGGGGLEGVGGYHVSNLCGKTTLPTIRHLLLSLYPSFMTHLPASFTHLYLEDGSSYFLRIIGKNLWCFMISYNGYQVFYGGKAAGEFSWPPSSAEVANVLELYLLLPLCLHKHVMGWPLPLRGLLIKRTTIWVFTAVNAQVSRRSCISDPDVFTRYAYTYTTIRLIGWSLWHSKRTVCKDSRIHDLRTVFPVDYWIDNRLPVLPQNRLPTVSWPSLLISADLQYVTKLDIFLFPAGYLPVSQPTLYDYYFDDKNQCWMAWKWMVPEYVHEYGKECSEILVPTADTVKTTWLLKLMNEVWATACSCSSGKTGTNCFLLASLLAFVAAWLESAFFWDVAPHHWIVGALTFRYSLVASWSKTEVSRVVLDAVPHPRRKETSACYLVRNKWRVNYHISFRAVLVRDLV